jgi:hypothetical protein
VSDFSSSDSAADLPGIIRLVRRICLFREQGETARAARLHADELVSAIAEYRLWHGPESLTEEKLCAIFVNETEHVREAIALAVVLAPELARLIPRGDAESEPVFPQMRSLGSVKPFSDRPPAIAELLDAMLDAGGPSAGDEDEGGTRRSGA